MAKKNPSSMWRNIRQQAYTRKEYMGGAPASRITQFDVGNLSADFPVKVVLTAEETCLIRHVAMEAARVTANRVINRVAGRQNYHLKFHVYPHQVLRHNKQASGAGADRVSQGMRKAFGKKVGTAALVRQGQQVMTIWTSRTHITLAKEALRKAGNKLPSPTRIQIIEEPAGA